MTNESTGLWDEILSASLRACVWTTVDECRMARERSVAGTADSIPDCTIHGPYIEAEPTCAGCGQPAPRADEYRICPGRSGWACS